MKMDITDVWDLCIKFMWGKDYILGLDKFFKYHNVKTILDCGGGTGFPSIELKKLGWDMTYSDCSDIMIGYFKRNLEQNKIEIPIYKVRWQELSQKIPQKFDALICRGNSLIYSDSWKLNMVEEIKKEDIKKIIGEFYKMLNKNGLLYVDITNKKAFDQKEYPIVKNYGEKIIDGKKIELTVKLTHDNKNKRRRFNGIFVIDGERYEFDFYVYLYHPDELRSVLKEVGFRKVEETKIEGEKNYTVLIGYK